MIIEAIPRKQKRNRPGVFEDASERARAVLNNRNFVEYAVKTAESIAAGRAELSVRTKTPPNSLDPVLEELIARGDIIDLGSKLYVHRETLGNVLQKLLDIVGRFHRKQPESPGITAEQFYEESGLNKDVFDGLLKLLITRGRLIEKKHRIALAGHRESFGEDEQELVENIEALFKSRLFNPPGLQEIIEQTGAGLEKVQRIIKILIEHERIIRVEKDMYFHRDGVEKARDILISYITGQGGLESVKFKYLLDTTRKFAIPLLDYFDRINLTRRSGYTRYLRTPPPK
jgi:selenocysteine-specific elongation factor